MPSRPSIPAEIIRAILLECGHRCAVCGTPVPLERAHIRPWHQSKQHKVEDLICLCANCHERADREKGGKKTLRGYKQKPWVHRQYKSEGTGQGVTRKVELILDLDAAQFDVEMNRRLLQFALAAFLDISPQSVRITSIEKTASVKVTIELPLESADNLLKAYARNEPELIKFLAALIPSECSEQYPQPPKESLMAKRYSGKMTVQTSAQRGLDLHPRPSQTVVQLAVAPGKPTCTPSPITTTGSNGDEDRYKGDDGKPNRIGSFHKGLPHDQFGEVVRAAYDSLLKAVKPQHKPVDFQSIQLGSGRKLTNPQAGLATDLEGPDPKLLKIRSAPRLDSAEEAAEAAEVYWMALLRDVPFTQFAINPLVTKAANDLSNLSDFTGPKIGGKVTPATIFRGCSHGDAAGPYISQFMLKDIPYGSLTISQRQRTVVGGLDYMTRFDEWLAVQNGDEHVTHDEFDGTRRYIRNMRDLGQYVHVDALYEAYLNAGLILLGMNTPVDDGNPYKTPNPDSKTQIGFGTFGGPHILSSVTEVATRALKAVWYQKWFVHRRLRPEAYGGLVHLKKTCTRNYPIHQQILDSRALQETFTRHGTYLLPMAFPEGSPTHPAYGAGHATVAGACVTILKAWFDENQPMPNPVVPTSDGLDLVPYVGPGANELTVGGELNKVAANIAIGRNMAGVHWRSDYTESVRLGERVAICTLFNQRKDYHEDCSFTFSSFDSDEITITKDKVTKNGQPYTAVCKD